MASQSVNQLHLMVAEVHRNKWRADSLSALSVGELPGLPATEPSPFLA